MNISQLILHLRTKNNISKAELARLSGITRSGVHLLETGQREPNLATLMRLLSVFEAEMCIYAGEDKIIIH